MTILKNYNHLFPVFMRGVMLFFSLPPFLHLVAAEGSMHKQSCCLAIRRRKRRIRHCPIPPLRPLPYCIGKGYKQSNWEIIIHTLNYVENGIIAFQRKYNGLIPSLSLLCYIHLTTLSVNGPGTLPIPKAHVPHLKAFVKVMFKVRMYLLVKQWK